MGAGPIEGKCTNLEGCDAYEKSFLAFEVSLPIIGNLPSNTGVLILDGENDTQTPGQHVVHFSENFLIIEINIILSSTKVPW